VVLYCPGRAQVDVGDTIRLGRVLALKRGDDFNVGRPYLDNVNIEAEVVEELRGPKVGLQQQQQQQQQQGMMLPSASSGCLVASPAHTVPLMMINTS
jgi:MarR-like DNA-binding transcriptional regulator SgrR of sgrS sRNA